MERAPSAGPLPRVLAVSGARVLRGATASGGIFRGKAVVLGRGASPPAAEEKAAPAEEELARPRGRERAAAALLSRREGAEPETERAVLCAHLSIAEDPGFRSRAAAGGTEGGPTGSVSPRREAVSPGRGTRPRASGGRRPPGPSSCPCAVRAVGRGAKGRCPWYGRRPMRPRPSSLSDTGWRDGSACSSASPPTRRCPGTSRPGSRGDRPSGIVSCPRRSPR